MSVIITWLLKGWLSRWATTAEGEIKDGWRWLTASPTHWMLALIVALGLFAGWEHHGKSAEHRERLAERATWSQAFVLERHAFTVQSANVAVLTSALTRQNAAVRALGTASARAHAQQQAALAAVDAERRSRAASAARQQAEAAGEIDGPDCRTPESVMADQGKL